MEGHSSLEFFFCTGTDPTMAFDLPHSFNGLIEVVSLIALPALQLKIYCFKNKHEPGPQTYKSFFKTWLLSEYEKSSIASFVTDLCGMIFIALGFLVGAVGFKVHWKDFGHYPYYLLANYVFLVGPSFGALLVGVMYFVRHEKLRKTCMRELLSFILTLCACNEWLNWNSYDAIGNTGCNVYSFFCENVDWKERKLTKKMPGLRH